MNSGSTNTIWSKRWTYQNNSNLSAM